jgi:hypothetical protein
MYAPLFPCSIQQKAHSKNWIDKHSERIFHLSMTCTVKYKRVMVTLSLQIFWTEYRYLIIHSTHKSSLSQWFPYLPFSRVWLFAIYDYWFQLIFPGNLPLKIFIQKFIPFLCDSPVFALSNASRDRFYMLILLKVLLSLLQTILLAAMWN